MTLNRKFFGYLIRRFEEGAIRIRHFYSLGSILSTNSMQNAEVHITRIKGAKIMFSIYFVKFHLNRLAASSKLKKESLFLF